MPPSTNYLPVCLNCRLHIYDKKTAPGTKDLPSRGKKIKKKTPKQKKTTTNQTDRKHKGKSNTHIKLASPAQGSEHQPAMKISFHSSSREEQSYYS